MGAERQLRPDDRELKALAEEIERTEVELGDPGKQTLAQQVDRLALILRQRANRPKPRAYGQPGISHPGQRALVGDMLTAMPKLEFSDCRALALRDVLSRLSKHRRLQAETLAAAVPHVAQRVAVRAHGAQTPEGQAMWGAANQRAVTLYRRATATGIGAPETRSVAEAIDAIGTGMPLPEDVRRKLEAVLGVSLANVRLHTGTVARDAAHAVCAEAFTVGEDIFFPSYDPTSARCQETLAHEVVHTIQWRQGRIRTAAGGPAVSRREDPLEREAEQAAQSIVAHAFRKPAESLLAVTPRAGTWNALRSPSATKLDSAPAPAPTMALHAAGVHMVMRKTDDRLPQRPVPELRREIPIGFIDHAGGADIWTQPSEKGGQLIRKLKPATRVFVSGTHPTAKAWLQVTEIPPVGQVEGASLAQGYVQASRVVTRLPEPNAELYQIAGGDTVEKVAARKYGKFVKPGRDLRFYENVLLHVNQQEKRPGIAGTPQTPDVFGQRSNGIQLLDGERIWLVSPQYAELYADAVGTGSLTGGLRGSMSGKHAWYQSPVYDVGRSIVLLPTQVSNVAGEYRDLIMENLGAIAGTAAALVIANAAAAGSLAIPVVGPTIATVLQLGISAYGIKVSADTLAAAGDHGHNWFQLAWTANGDSEQIEEASREFLRMFVTLLMFAVSGAGTYLSIRQAGKYFNTPPRGGITRGDLRANSAGGEDLTTVKVKNPDGTVSFFHDANTRAPARTGQHPSPSGGGRLLDPDDYLPFRIPAMVGSAPGADALALWKSQAGVRTNANHPEWITLYPAKDSDQFRLQDAIGHLHYKMETIGDTQAITILDLNVIPDFLAHSDKDLLRDILETELRQKYPQAKVSYKDKEQAARANPTGRQKPTFTDDQSIRIVREAIAAIPKGQHPAVAKQYGLTVKELHDMVMEWRGMLQPVRTSGVFTKGQRLEIQAMLEGKTGDDFDTAWDAAQKQFPGLVREMFDAWSHRTFTALEKRLMVEEALRTSVSAVRYKYGPARPTIHQWAEELKIKLPKTETRKQKEELEILRFYDDQSVLDTEAQFNIAADTIYKLIDKYQWVKKRHLADPATKAAAVAKMEHGANQDQLADELDVSVQTLHKWRRDLRPTWEADQAEKARVHEAKVARALALIDQGVSIENAAKAEQVSYGEVQKANAERGIKTKRQLEAESTKTQAYSLLDQGHTETEVATRLNLSLVWLKELISQRELRPMTPEQEAEAVADGLKLIDAGVSIPNAARRVGLKTSTLRSADTKRTQADPERVARKALEAQKLQEDLARAFAIMDADPAVTADEAARRVGRPAYIVRHWDRKRRGHIKTPLKDTTEQRARKKAQALELVRGGASVAEAARAVGMNRTTLSNAVKDIPDRMDGREDNTAAENGDNQHPARAQGGRPSAPEGQEQWNHRPAPGSELHVVNGVPMKPLPEGDPKAAWQVLPDPSTSFGRWAKFLQDTFDVSVLMHPGQGGEWRPWKKEIVLPSSVLDSPPDFTTQAHEVKHMMNDLRPRESDEMWRGYVIAGVRAGALKDAPKAYSDHFKFDELLAYLVEARAMAIGLDTPQAGLSIQREDLHYYAGVALEFAGAISNYINSALRLGEGQLLTSLKTKDTLSFNYVLRVRSDGKKQWEISVPAGETPVESMGVEPKSISYKAEQLGLDRLFELQERATAAKKVLSAIQRGEVPDDQLVTTLRDLEGMLHGLPKDSEPKLSHPKAAISVRTNQNAGHAEDKASDRNAARSPGRTK